MKIFSNYSDLRPNSDKCEIAGIGVLKGVNWTLCGLKSIDLTQQTIKIQGIHFSYNTNLRDEKNFTDTVKKIESLLHVWCQRSMTLEGKITIFKSLAISKIVYIAYLSSVPKTIINELNKIQNHFLWNGKRTKIKHRTLCNSFETGGLQSVDIEVKLKALQLSWIHRLFDQKEHQWKSIPRFLLRKNFGETNIFYHHFSPNKEALRSFPNFYQTILTTWMDCSDPPITPASILNQRIWHNHFLIIENNPFFFKDFAQVNFNYVYQMFTPDGRMKTWPEIKTEFNLNDRMYFRFFQLVHSIPPEWRQTLTEADPVDVMPTQGILQCTKIIPLEKLISKQIYTILIRKRAHIPTSRLYYNNKFPTIENEWLKIYTLPRKVSKLAYDRVFQYKILNNVLFLNKKLFMFGLSETSLCSFCAIHDEDIPHLFFHCPETSSLWLDLVTALLPNCVIPELDQKTALLGLFDAQRENYNMVNHILIIFKIYLYQCRSSGALSINALLNKILATARLELSLAPEGTDKYEYYENKWRPLLVLLND